jgi:flavin-dependent dehydrogenase
MTRAYDVIVVGARCAGSPTAIRLARKGYNVVVVDRATFPSDTVSTHLVHPPGVDALQRWGLLDRVRATGCPPIPEYMFDMGAFSITGTPGLPHQPSSYAPRRTVLDKILVDAASEAGAEVREGFAVEDVLIEEGRVTGIRGSAGGKSFTERARIVIGADGISSLVARSVGAETYQEKPRLLAAYYSYWSGLSLKGFEAYDRGDRSWAAWPTNDGLTLVIVGWPYAEFETNRQDIEGNFLAALDRAPAFGERLRAGKREDRFYGMAVPNFFRQSYGPGWALVGDAGYNKDFITAQGISDAFHQAERCADAVDASFSGARPFDEAMKNAQTHRDDYALKGGIYEFTCQFASMQPPTPEMQQLLKAVSGNREASDGFARVFSGVVSPARFFSEENVRRIVALSSAAS